MNLLMNSSHFVLWINFYIENLTSSQKNQIHFGNMFGESVPFPYRIGLLQANDHAYTTKRLK